MVDDVERQAEQRTHIDATLVLAVISQVQTANINLGSILGRTDAVVKRQNWLTVLFILSLSLNILQLALGLSLQHVVSGAKAQLTAVDFGREELLSAVKEAKREVSNIRGEMETVRMSLQAAPTVTADSKGRISLEVSLDASSQKATLKNPDPPEKVVIPLKPSQSRLE